MILVTGGAGFIGSNFVQNWLTSTKEKLINLDKLTYAGNKINLDICLNDPNHIFIEGDIGDSEKVFKLLEQNKPRAVINFAAESHVDRSIELPGIFFETNVMGTLNLLESCKKYWLSLEGKEKENFRFLHISTDEVYGSLDKFEEGFDEDDPFRPNSPYSASKASSDLLVRSYFKTFNFPVLTSNCSNNFGPHQYPEKLIPLTIFNLIQKKEIPIYGKGDQVRDWLFVTDHCEAIKLILEKGTAGQVYNVGGNNERENLEVVKEICRKLDSVLPRDDLSPYEELIKFVDDRPGHDLRYAINSKKIKTELGWEPVESFNSGLDKTIQWYLNNPLWLKEIKSTDYSEWINKQYS